MGARRYGRGQLEEYEREEDGLLLIITNKHFHQFVWDLLSQVKATQEVDLWGS